jgi:DNA-binding transcriptional LysR family regulator
MKMLKLEWIRTLADVHQMGSFTAVANSRGVSAMAISKQVSGLESQLNEPLINRSHRKVSLTESGVLLLERSQVLLDEHTALNDWLEGRNQKPSGTLKVAGLEEEVIALTITPWVSEFLDLYPDIHLELNLITDFQQILEIPTDIYWGLGKYLGDKQPGLKRKPLLTSRYGIYASDRYLARYGEPKTPSDLTDHYVIGNLNNKPTNSLIVKGGLGFQSDDYDGDYLKAKVTTVTGSFELAEQGLGIINCAEVLFDSYYAQRHERLKPILQDYWMDGIEAFAYYHQTKIEQPKVRAFLDFFYEKRNQWV